MNALKLIKQRNKWECLGCAFAMVTHRSIDELIKIVDNDGSPEGWSLAEMFYYIHKLGKTCTPLLRSAEVMLEDGTIQTRNVSQFDEMAAYMLKHNNAVIIINQNNEYDHAVAWDCSVWQILDPNGANYGIKGLDYDQLFIVR